MELPNADNGSLTLSWGSDEELLVGSSSLRLYQTSEEDALIWTRNLPKPVKIAEFSWNSGFIASTGSYDRLIKLWRRQSSGPVDTRFDFTYLPHPATITTIHWRKSSSEHISDSVLFSICADSKVRIWAVTDPHGVQTLQLWAEIDMQESIQPRQVSNITESKERYAFIIDSADFKFATERAIKAASVVSHTSQNENHALEHLVEIAKTSPEVCVVLDRRGNMSAWGLENVGCKVRKSTDKFNVAHVENVNLLFLNNVIASDDNVRFLNFCVQESNVPFSLLVHHFDGRIVWFESNLDELFDPSPRRDRVHANALWTGHDGSIKKIVRSVSGKALISRTNDNEGLIWKQSSASSGMVLIRSSSLSCPDHIHRIWILEEGDFIITLHHYGISLWDARSSIAEKIAFHSFEAAGRPLCLLPLPHPDPKSSISYMATITSKMEAIVWEVSLPSGSQENSNGQPGASIKDLCSSRLGFDDDLAFILPIDPAGLPPTVPGFLDVFAKDLAVSYTNKGVLRAWTAIVEPQNRRVKWLITSSTETDIDSPSLASGSSIRKIAVIDKSKTGLSIWDSRNSQLEFEVRYEPSDTVRGLDWSSTPDQQSILAVGFPFRIVILAQMRYDYLNAGPAWAPIREISIKELTSHPIGDSVWLGSGNLVVGAGNQLYVYDKEVATSDKMILDLSVPMHQQQSWDVFNLVTYLNGPLPVFHPQFLAQCLLAGKLVQVQRIIINLFKALKFYVPGDELDSFVSLSPMDFYTEQEVTQFAFQAGCTANNGRVYLTLQERRSLLPTQIMPMTMSQRLSPKIWRPQSTNI